jgi:hypothetical protein
VAKKIPIVARRIRGAPIPKAVSGAFCGHRREAQYGLHRSSDLQPAPKSSLDF